MKSGFGLVDYTTKLARNNPNILPQEMKLKFGVSLIHEFIKQHTRNEADVK